MADFRIKQGCVTDTLMHVIFSSIAVSERRFDRRRNAERNSSEHLLKQQNNHITNTDYNIPNLSRTDCGADYFQRLCYLNPHCLLKIIVKLDSYVLLAANADDFRNIAKQIVPGALANKLARLASVSAKENSPDKSEETEYYYETEAEEVDEDIKEDSVIEENVKDYERSQEDTYVNEWKTRVNFDELVERVKDRLAKELSVKLKQHVWNPTQSIYNGFDQKGAQSKNPADEDVVYDNNSNENSLKNKKTYGYNNSKNNLQPDKKPQNTNSYISPDFQMLDPQTSPVETIDQYKESLENNKFIFNGENIQEAKFSKGYVDGHANDKEYFSKEKHSIQVNHEEGNDMFHLQNNKDVSNGADERQKNIQNGDFSKQYMNTNGNSPKSAEIYDSETKNGGVESQNNNENVFNQFNTKQKVFDGTYNIDNNKPVLYEEFDLASKRKNDSYEDYVIPSAQNKYASEETSSPINQDRAKLKKNLSNNNEKSRFEVQFNDKLQNVKPLKHEVQHVKNEEVQDDYTEVIDKSQEIKAKTESLLYNYDEVKLKTTKHNRVKDKKTVTVKATTKKLRAKGTMIPTREHFKMASPNYYISIPTVVEKYDPNEPLPEKDREREVIKHFVNPPASINKKIKLS